MTYAYDDWVQMPTKDLYDTAIMKMAIDAAKDMYDRGQTQMENFYKTYGDFMSPFAKDMEKYGNMMNNIRTTINDAYARGIDLFKSPEGRMLVQQLSHSIDPTWYNTAKQNAKVGYAYLDAMQDLRKRGKYSEAQELFDIAYNGGINFQDFSTSDDKNRLRIWDRSSPIESISLQEMVHPSFANIKPHLLSREEAISRVGSNYDPKAEYTGVTRADMESAMRSALPGLMGTPMYEYYKNEAKKELIAEGKNPTEAEINARFVQNAVTADSQMMTPLSKDYSRYFQEENLKLKRSANDLAWKKYEWDKQKEQQEIYIKAAKAAGDTGGAGTSLTGMPLAQMWYDKGIANSLSAGGITLTWDQIHNNYGAYSKEIYNQAAKFGEKAMGGTPAKQPTNEDLLNTDYAKKHGNLVKTALNHPQEKRPPRLQNAIEEARKEWISKNSTGVVPTNEVKEKFKSQYTITMDASQVAKAIGDAVSGNDRVVQASAANVEKLFGENDVVTGTAGYTRTHEGNDTKELRDAIEKYGAKNTRITPMGDGYASLRKTGKFEVMPRVRVQVVDDNGEIKYNRDAYYNIGVSGQGNRQGAYIGDNKKVRMHGPEQSAMKAQLEELQKKERQYANLYSPDQNNLYSPSRRSPEVQKKLDETRVQIERLKNAMTIYNENFVDEHYEGDHSLYPDYDNWFLLGDWARHDISQMK